MGMVDFVDHEIREGGGHLQRHKTWWFGLYDHIRQMNSRQGGSDLGGVQRAHILGGERSSF